MKLGKYLLYDQYKALSSEQMLALIFILVSILAADMSQVLSYNLNLYIEKMHL